LIGIYVDQGVINLSKTLKELGVNDTSFLSEKELHTTLLDMIRSRSGVYHPAAYETPGMKDARPKRNSHQPGEFWYYNNWDFNALGKIFEELTGSSIFNALETLIAKPIGMQDFSAATDGDYRKEPESEYPSYDFFMSARDMARFGYLFLRNGRWQDQQIISKEWIDRSTMSYTQGTSTERNPFYGYGFMWWTNELGYYALGAGGHAIAVIPSKDLVIVHRMANDDEYDTKLAVITPQATNTTLRMIVDGAPT
jgi:CubicO group peptidase (beta-lactamase class C family)